MKEEGEQGNEKVPIFMVVVAGNNSYFFPFLKSQTIYLNHLLMYFFSVGWGQGVVFGCFFWMSYHSKLTNMDRLASKGNLQASYGFQSKIFIKINNLLAKSGEYVLSYL